MLVRFIFFFSIFFAPHSMGQDFIEKMFDEAVEQDYYPAQIAQMSALAVLFSPRFENIFNKWATKNNVDAFKIVVDMKEFGCRVEHLEKLAGWPQE